MCKQYRSLSPKAIQSWRHNSPLLTSLNNARVIRFTKGPIDLFITQFLMISTHVQHSIISVLHGEMASMLTMTTATQHIVGTYPYIAPEMFTIGHQGAAVDVYSLGCLYIELFGKKRVWPAGMSSPQIMQRICGSFQCPPMGPSVDHLPPKQQLLCSLYCQLVYKMQPKISKVIKLLNDC